GRKRWGEGIFVILYSLITFLMFADAAYSSYFGKYISVNQIWQLSSLREIAADGDVLGAAVSPLSFFTLLDYPFALWWFRRVRSMEKEPELRVWERVVGRGEKKWQQLLKENLPWVRRALHLVLYSLALFCFIYYGFNVTNERYVQKVNHIEFFTYHTNDLIVNVGGRIARRNVNEEEILKEMEAIVPKSEGSLYHGAAKGMNLILIQVESLNDFVIGADYEGQELTPYLNQMIQEDSFYFDRFYSTTGVGNTCDAEFATMNSLYANDERECYRMYVDNTYNGLPWMLKEEGYSTMAFHGYVKTFWNREEAYKNQGIDHFYSEEELEMTQKSGFGLTDKEMFRQAVDILKTKEEPFFSFMITLTNHIPYDMPQSLATLDLSPEDEKTMFGRYLQTVHYTDEAIGDLISYLKEAGLYDHTMIVIYGDHQGLNKETQEVSYCMTDYLGKPYDFDEMLKIPLIIHIPGLGEHKVITTVGGQIDTAPTIANLMDLDFGQPYRFGDDLLNTREGFIAQISYIGKGSYIDGSNGMIFAIGKDGSVENGRVLRVPDGEPMNLNQDLCQKCSDRAVALLDLCKEVLDHNLIANYVTH
ncbi:MAG: sulfatase-like hydrolase/transferase, partial [Eubacterium sp.]|nr:sulfatase-like hydrolase/transferase [Eubacterium sp.]